MGESLTISPDPDFYRQGNKTTLAPGPGIYIVLYWEPYFDSEQTLRKAFTVDAFAFGYSGGSKRYRFDVFIEAVAKVHELERSMVIDAMAAALLNNQP